MLTDPGSAHPAPIAQPRCDEPRPFRVVLIGNYPRDGQESMQRFALMLRDGLRAAGCRVELLLPPVVLGRLGSSTVAGFGKWLGYLDKHLIFPIQLRRHLRRARERSGEEKLIVHICDHSNATYAAASRGGPLVITCHDLLAVRGALGEDTDCPASRAGRVLQQWILRGLGRATVIACDSDATQADVGRLVTFASPVSRTTRIHLDLNYPYRPLPESEVAELLGVLPALTPRYILHVGSNLRRKNREGVLRIFARTAGQWDAQLVFAGQPLSTELRALAASLHIEHRILEVPKPSNELLTALYNRATALLFPSRFEGFGWPVIEAQACGCPVLSSRSTSLPEVTGNGGFIREIDDEAGFAHDLLSLRDPAVLQRLREASLLNARRFTAGHTLAAYLELYRRLASA